MLENDSEKQAPRYTLKPTFTPLPHSAEKAKAEDAPATPSVIRDANEDDDLYDPYSDYHDGTLKAAEFEADPWR